MRYWWILTTVGVLATYTISETVASEDILTTTSSENITEDDSEFTSYGDLPWKKREGVVTLEFSTDNTTDDETITKARQQLRSAVARILSTSSNDVTTVPPGTNDDVTTDSALLLRLRRDSSSQYSEDGVTLVAVDPEVKDSRLRVPLVVQSQDGDVVPAETLKDSLQENEDEVSDAAGLPMQTVYVGMPPDVLPVRRRSTVWEKHFWLFIVVIILLLIALLVALLCLCCFRCRAKPVGDKEPVIKKSAPPPQQQKKPAPVEEMVEVSPVIPLQSAPPPSPEGPKGSEPPHDEENGWIIPLDQLSQEDLEGPDVQISKL